MNMEQTLKYLCVSFKALHSLTYSLECTRPISRSPIRDGAISSGTARESVLTQQSCTLLHWNALHLRKVHADPVVPFLCDKKVAMRQGSTTFPAENTKCGIPNHDIAIEIEVELSKIFHVPPFFLYSAESRLFLFIF